MNKLQVLLIGDSRESIELLVLVFGTSDIAEVVSCLSVRDDIQECIQGLQRLDLVIVDAGLPHSKGVEAVAQVRADNRFNTTAIAYMSAMISKSAEIDAISAGSDLYILKPCDLVKLLSDITNLLHDRGLLAANKSLDL
jgi:DNA-binding response OmpR family regulator